MPQISIVMPVYNSEKYLKDTLESLRQQTFQNYELICVNDGSTDKSLEILEDFNKKYNNFIKIISTENQGAGTSRNYGFQFAKGETTIFLDSDDYFHPNFLEELYNQYKKTNSDIVICKYDVTLPDGSLYLKNQGIRFDTILKKEIFNKYDIPDYIFCFCNYSPWNKLYKTEFIREHNLKFDNIPYNNDVFFVILSLFFADKITTVDKILVNYKIFNPESATSKRKQSGNLNLCQIFDRLEKIFFDNSGNEIFRKSFNSAYMFVFMYCIKFLDNKDKKQLVGIIKNRFKQIPERKDFCKSYLYRNLLFIKIFPAQVYVLIYEFKSIIKKMLKCS